MAPSSQQARRRRVPSHPSTSCEVCREPTRRVCDQCPYDQPDRYVCDKTACRRIHADRAPSGQGH